MMGGLFSCVELSFVWSDSGGTLDLDKNEHVAILSISMALFLIYCIKFAVEIMKEPDWKCLFVAYFVLITVGTVIQLYLSYKASDYDDATYTNASAGSLWAAFLFCLSQFMFSIIYAKYTLRKMKKITGADIPKDVRLVRRK